VAEVVRGLVHPSLGLAMASLLRADTIVLLRNTVATIAGIFLPVMLIIASTFAKAQTRLGGTEVIIGLALTLGLVTSCILGYSLAIAHDRDAGVLQRLRVTQAPTWTIMTSRLLVQAAASLVSSVIVIIVAVMLHGLALNAGQYVLVLAVAILGSAMFLALGQALVGLVKSVSAINAIGRLLFIVLVLLGILGATGILGDTVQNIAAFSPVGALMTLFTDVLTSAGWADQDLTSLLVCAGYIGVFAFIGIRFFRWESR
jgi:ABC-2 type transport system permease protein